MRGYWLESGIIYILSIFFFLAMLNGQWVAGFTKKLWPEYQVDPYFTLLVERKVSPQEAIKIKKNIFGIKEIIILDREALRLKLYQKLKKKNIEFPEALLDRDISQLKFFLSSELDHSMYQLIQEKIKSYFFDTHMEMSQVKTLRKTLKMSREMIFFKRWGKEVLIIMTFILWAIGMSFFYWRTYPIISLYQRFQYKKFMFEVFYGVLLSMILALTLGGSYFLGGTLNGSGFFFSLFMIILYIGFLRISNILKGYSK